MKILLSFAVLLALATCQTYIMNVSNECSFAYCPRSFWSYNNVNYNYTCPTSGSNQSRLKNVNNKYFFEFFTRAASPNYQVTIPLIYNSNFASSNGIQYYQNLQSGSFVILNCTIAAAKHQSNLCSKHALVGGKILNTVFQSSCAFGLDAPRLSFLQERNSFEFISSD